MAYQVDKFNGQFFVSVEDGTIDTTSDLRLVGKNYAGYGEVQNENFLHLLENFANTTPPPKAIAGQLWYDNVSTNKKLKYYDGNIWKVAGGAEVSATAPSGLTTGDFWWDTASSQLKAWNGTEFILVGPESSPDLGTSTVTASVVKGLSTSGDGVGPHTILKVFANDKVVGIFSKNEFTLDNSQNPIEDFSVVKKGFTLAKSQTGVSTDNYVMWGSAQNANQLGGINADQYLRRGDNSFTGEVQFFDPGFTVGNDNDLRIRIDNSVDTVIENRLGNPIAFRITVNELSDKRDVAIIRRDGIFPDTDNLYTLGGLVQVGQQNQLRRWSNVFSETFTGNLVGNVTGNTNGVHTGNVIASDSTVIINGTTKQIGYAGANLVGTLTGSVTGTASSATNASKLNDLEPSVAVPVAAIQTVPIRDASGNIAANQFIGTSDRTDRMRINNSATDVVWNGAVTSTQYRSAMTTQTAWTIAARDANADITARVFVGTATAARYADLAEKYLADADYEVGTVVAVGGEKEVTACQWGDRAIGVVSANPAYMMNSELEGGTYIALKGRVPVKVNGSVKKGQRLIASSNGTAMAAVPHSNDVFAIALESNDDNGVKIIEALVL